MRRRSLVIALCLLAVLVAAGGAVYGWRWWQLQPVNPLAASGQPQTVVMDFSKPVAFDPPATGWLHREFWTRPPMTISQGTKDGVAAARFETDGSGSIFGRFTDVSLGDYPTLAWNWFVEKPIDSPLDERTREGDDHPARLFIAIDDSEGGRHFLEVIWSNRVFKAGDYKYIGDFPHYVANGGDENIGRWIEEKIDLLGIYREITKRDDIPRVTFIAVFCDSDDTGTSSIAWFSKVWLAKPD